MKKNEKTEKDTVEQAPVARNVAPRDEVKMQETQGFLSASLTCLPSLSSPSAPRATRAALKTSVSSHNSRFKP